MSNGKKVPLESVDERPIINQFEATFSHTKIVESEGWGDKVLQYFYYPVDPITKKRLTVENRCYTNDRRGNNIWKYIRLAKEHKYRFVLKYPVDCVMTGSESSDVYGGKVNSFRFDFPTEVHDLTAGRSWKWNTKSKKMEENSQNQMTEKPKTGQN